MDTHTDNHCLYMNMKPHVSEPTGWLSLLFEPPQLKDFS